MAAISSYGSTPMQQVPSFTAQRSVSMTQVPVVPRTQVAQNVSMQGMSMQNMACAPACPPKPTYTSTIAKTECVQQPPVCKTTVVPGCAATAAVATGMTEQDWIKWGSYAGYGGVGLGVIIFILLVIAVIVLWIRMNNLVAESREYLVYRYNGDSKDFYLPAEDRNILFINETHHCIKLHVCPKSNQSGNNSNNPEGGDILYVKNAKCGGTVKIVPIGGLTYNDGNLQDENIVTGSRASQFCWVTNTELMRLT